MIIAKVRHYSLGTARTQLAARSVRSMRDRTEQATRSAEETTFVAGLYGQLWSSPAGFRQLTGASSNGPADLGMVNRRGVPPGVKVILPYQQSLVRTKKEGLQGVAVPVVCNCTEVVAGLRDDLDDGVLVGASSSAKLLEGRARKAYLDTGTGEARLRGATRSATIPNLHC